MKLKDIIEKEPKVTKKPIYRNDKSGKYYTFDKQGLYSVDIEDGSYIILDRLDKNNRKYTVSLVYPYISQYGFKRYITGPSLKEWYYEGDNNYDNV